MKKIFCSSIFLFVLAQAAGAGNHCVWTGGAGDGKWSSAANWTIAPVSGNGDALSFEGGELTTENDIEGMSVAGIRCTGTGEKTFNGKEITLTGGAFPSVNINGVTLDYTMSNSCSVVYNTDLKIGGEVRAVFEPGVSSASFYGDIHILPGKTFYIGYPYTQTRDKGPARPITFYGGILGPEGTIIWGQWAQSTVSTYGKIDVNVFDFNYPASRIYLPQFSGSVRVRSGEVNLWYGFLQFASVDTFGEYLPVLSWPATGKFYDKDRSSYNLQGFSQTIDRLGPGRDVSDNAGNNVTSSSAATLTMKATADSTTLGIICGAVSVVWDPVADYTLTFRKRASNTTGSITVKAGTVALTEGATFASAEAIIVGENASFIVDTAASNPLAALKELNLSADSRFTLTDNCVSPFGTSADLSIRMVATAKLSLPEGIDQSVRDVFINGVPLLPGTYTGPEGTGGTVVDFIEGTGRIVIVEKGNLTAWKNAADGSWHTDSNWTAGVPTSDGNVYVVQSGTYSIDMTGEVVFGELTAAAIAGQVKLSARNKIQVDADIMKLGTNAVFDIAKDGDFELGSPSDVSSEDDVITISDGGKFFSAGRFVASNLYGRINVTKGGLLCMTGGTFIAAPPKVIEASNVITIDGGTFAVTNATMRLGYNFNSSQNKDIGVYPTLITKNGAKAFFHDTNLTLLQWFNGNIFGTGRTVFSGNSKFVAQSYIRMGLTPDHSAETCYVDFYGNASFGGMQELAVCDNRAGGSTIMTLDSPGVRVTGFAGVQVGCQNGYGEVNLKNGYMSGGGSYGLSIGYKSPRVNNCAINGCNPTGRVKVSGGILYVSVHDFSAGPVGLIVGNGNPTEYASFGVTSKFTGYLDISGEGIVTNRSRLFVGVGYGFGRVTMSGGNFRGVINPNTQKLLHGAIGLAGGEGEWRQTGGAAEMSYNMFVGGAETNLLGLGKMANTVFVNCRHAKGLLEVKGGTFTVKDADIYASALGEGEISISGTGAISARNVILTNSVDEAGVTCFSTVRAVVDADGKAGSITASDTFVIQSDSRFICDFAGYEGAKTSFPIIKAGTISGKFLEENIDITGDLSKYAYLRQTATSIDVIVNRGLILTVK